MSKVKLIKGRSYTGYGVTVFIERPCIDVDKKVADALIASGYFSLVAESADDSNSDSEKPIEKMTEKELDVYATENGINLTGVSGKAKKLATIQKAIAATEAGSDESDLFNGED